MTERTIEARLINTLLPFAVAAAIGLMLVAGFGVGTMRQGVIVAGALGFIGVAYLSGRPRLVCLWALMITLPLNLSMSITAFSTRGGGETAIKLEASDIFLGGLFFFMLIEIFSRRRSALRLPRVCFVWVALMVMGLVSVAYGDFQRVAAFEVFRMGKVLLLFIVLANELRSRRQVLHASLAIGLGVLLQAGVGVAQHIKGTNLGLEMLGETNRRTIEILSKNSVHGMDVWRVSGLSLHPNLFGIFLAATLPLLAGLFLSRINNWFRLAALVTSGCAVVSLLATYSRSSWVSFAAAITLFLTLALVHRRLRGRSVKPAFVVAIVTASILAVFSGQIIQRLFHSQADATVGRQVFNEDALRLIAEKPLFGWGMNTYVDVVVEYSKYSREAQDNWIPPVHHIYYLWWSELGIVGLALHLAVIACVLYYGVKNLRIRDPLLYIVSAACMCGVIAFIVDGFFSFSLRVGGVLRLFWVFAGLIMAVHYLAVRGETDEQADEGDGEFGPVLASPRPVRDASAPGFVSPPRRSLFENTGGEAP